jgi:hypothetical protein
LRVADRIRQVSAVTAALVFSGLVSYTMPVVVESRLIEAKEEIT